MYGRRDHSARGFDRVRSSTNDDIIDNEDPDYKTMLQNLKEHGSSYALTLYHGNYGEPEILEYEITDSPLELPRASEDSPPTRRKPRPRARDENKRVVPTRRKASGARNRSSGRELSAEKNNVVDKEYMRFVNLGCSDFAEGDCAEEASGFPDSEYRKLVSLYCDSSGGGDRAVGRKQDNAGGEFSNVAEDYVAYLDLLDMECEDKRHEAEGIETSLDLVVFDEDDLHFDRNSTPFVSSRPSHLKDVDSLCVSKDCDVSRSKFKEELIKVLKKPYDSKQHRHFKREVEYRRPILGDIDRDGKTKTRPSKLKLGKSYLALYTDFAKLIEAQTDNRKSLNLLRGFFFWLENISRDDAFRPWDDPSILRVLPLK